MKKCKGCNIVKNLNDFYKDKNCKQGVKPKCKDCIIESKRIYKQANPCLIREQVRRQAKKYYESNKEKARAANKKWRESHQELRKSYRQNTKSRQNNINRERYKTDVNYRLMRSLRARMTHALKSNSKSESTAALTGCTMDELKTHLESLFQPGMSWANHGHGAGNWHIDHIKACTSFDLSRESEQRLCFHHSNMQPLWAIDNLKKGGTFDIEEDTLTSIYLLFE